MNKAGRAQRFVSSVALRKSSLISQRPARIGSIHFEQRQDFPHSLRGFPTIRSLSTSASVSDAEVSKFSKFSQTWWDPRENPLVGMNPIRVKYMVDFLNSKSVSHNQQAGLPLEGMNALDVGCGGGLLSESLARLGAKVTSIDPSEPLVEEAKRHAQLDQRTRSIEYRGGWTAERLAEEVAMRNLPKYDLICMLEVIEHVQDPPSILKAVASLLKDDGTLFLSTVNKTVKSKAVAIVGAEYIMGYLPVGTHDWNQFKSPGDIRALVQDAGLDEAHVAGMVLTSPPFFGQWNWKIDDNDTDVNWIGAYAHNKPLS